MEFITSKELWSIIETARFVVFYDSVALSGLELATQTSHDLPLASGIKGWATRSHKPQDYLRAETLALS